MVDGGDHQLKKESHVDLSAQFLPPSQTSRSSGVFQPPLPPFSPPLPLPAAVEVEVSPESSVDDPNSIDI